MQQSHLGATSYFEKILLNTVDIWLDVFTESPFSLHKVNICHPLYSGLALVAAQTTATVALAPAPAPAPAAGSPARAPTAQSTTAGGAGARRLGPAGVAMQPAG